MASSFSFNIHTEIFCVFLYRMSHKEGEKKKKEQQSTVLPSLLITALWSSTSFFFRGKKNGVAQFDQ